MVSVEYVPVLTNKLYDIFSEDYLVNVTFIQNENESFYRVFLKDLDTINDYVYFIIKSDGIHFLNDFYDNDPELINYVISHNDDIMDAVKN